MCYSKIYYLIKNSIYKLTVNDKKHVEIFIIKYYNILNTKYSQLLMEINSY